MTDSVRQNGAENQRPNDCAKASAVKAASRLLCWFPGKQNRRPGQFYASDPVTPHQVQVSELNTCVGRQCL